MDKILKQKHRNWIVNKDVQMDMYEQFVKRQLRIINCECVLTFRDGNGGSPEASVRWDSD